jgi:predicted metalloprotease
MAAVFSHEFGHAIQGPPRLNLDPPQYVYLESQADCAAGAFLAWAKDGHAPHYRPTDADIDRALAGYLQVRDGTPEAGEELSHGNGFDRLAAVANGLKSGVTFCFDPGYYENTKLTERPFVTDEDYKAGGNVTLEEVLAPGADGLNLFADLNRFWKAAAASIGKTWTDIQVKQAAHPACGSLSPASEFGYCPDDNTVYYSHAYAEMAYNSLEGKQFDPTTGDVKIVSGQPADFALGTLFAVAWGMGVRHQLFGETMTGQDGLLAAMCYTGAYAKDINLPNDQADDSHPLVLSPPDLDEATSATVNLVGMDQAFGSRGTSGLGRVQAFVKGYSGGLSVC